MLNKNEKQNKRERGKIFFMFLQKHDAKQNYEKKRNESKIY